MCIRDRGETVEFQDNDDLGIITNVLTLLESNELSGIKSIDVSNHSNIKMVYKAVSYTHLDVYKRQQHGSNRGH